MYAGYLLIVTLHPFEFSRSLQSFSVLLSARLGLRDVVVNILLFIPFGVLLYCRLVATRTRRSAVLIATLVGGIFSFGIELFQILTVRQPSVFDVLANTLGSGTGSLLATLWPLRAAAPVGRLGTRVAASGNLLRLTLLFGAVPLLLTVLQLTAPFSVWNSRSSFKLGNEATMHRPWLGKIYLVAVYKRALSADEITHHFRNGFMPATSSTSARKAIIALYTFTEGKGDVIYDKSGFESPLNLEISSLGHVRWLRSSNGIEIFKPAVVRSSGPANKLIAALRTTGELSIEVMMRPDNPRQGGPARIVALSRDDGARNFMLGQQGTDIQFRLRTLVSALNRTPLGTATTDKIVVSEKVHVVATYKNGVERLYVNGRQQTDVLDLTSDKIIGLGARKTPIAQIAYSFLYFFPVSFSSALFFSGRSRGFLSTILLSTATGAGWLIMTEIFQSIAFAKAIDLPLVIYGVIVTSTGAVSGVSNLREQTEEFPIFKRTAQ